MAQKTSFIPEHNVNQIIVNFKYPTIELTRLVICTLFLIYYVEIYIKSGEM